MSFCKRERRKKQGSSRNVAEKIKFASKKRNSKVCSFRGNFKRKTKQTTETTKDEFHQPYEMWLPCMKISTATIQSCVLDAACITINHHFYYGEQVAKFLPAV